MKEMLVIKKESIVKHYAGTSKVFKNIFYAILRHILFLYIKYLAKRPFDIITYYNRARTYFRLRKYKIAIHCLNRSIEYNRYYLGEDNKFISKIQVVDSIRTNGFLVNTFKNIEGYKENQETNRHYLLEAYLMKGMCYNELKRSKRAMKYYEKVESIIPGYTKKHMMDAANQYMKYVEKLRN